MSNSGTNDNARMTPEKFREHWDKAGEMIAADAAFRLWTKLYAERRAIREVAKGI